MSNATTGVFQRVIAEHRRAIYVLVAGFVINVVAFAFFVYPLMSDVANVEQRTRAAESGLAAAQAEFGAASGTLTGRDQAVKELDTFYNAVLSPDLPSARKLTFARLAQMAEKSRLDFERRSYEPIVEQGSNLTRLKVAMELGGNYANVRDFIHEIESAPEFVVIDNISLSQVADDSGSLRLALELSTYFRNTAR